MPPRAGSTRRAARALLLEGFVGGLWDAIDGDDRGIAELARDRVEGDRMNAAIRLNSALSVSRPVPRDPRGWHYLDSAATAQKPQAVIDAITNAYGRDYATVHRGVYERSAAMTQSFEAARAAAADLIGGQTRAN